MVGSDKHPRRLHELVHRPQRKHGTLHLTTGFLTENGMSISRDGCQSSRDDVKVTASFTDDIPRTQLFVIASASKLALMQGPGI